MQNPRRGFKKQTDVPNFGFRGEELTNSIELQRSTLEASTAGSHKQGAPTKSHARIDTVRHSQDNRCLIQVLCLCETIDCIVAVVPKHIQDHEKAYTLGEDLTRKQTLTDVG